MWADCMLSSHQKPESARIGHTAGIPLHLLRSPVLHVAGIRLRIDELELGLGWAVFWRKIVREPRKGELLSLKDIFEGGSSC